MQSASKSAVSSTALLHCKQNSLRRQQRAGVNGRRAAVLSFPTSLLHALGTQQQLFSSPNTPVAPDVPEQGAVVNKKPKTLRKTPREMTFLPPGSKSLLPNSLVSSLCMLECDFVHRSSSETIWEPPEDNEHGHLGLHRSGSREGDTRNEIQMAMVYGTALSLVTFIAKHRAQRLGGQHASGSCSGQGWSTI